MRGPFESQDAATMPIGSTTADIHMINIALTAADGSGQVWQDATQMIPVGLNGNPEVFVASLKAGLPLVNTLRVVFNEYSFNTDGSMNPLFERFLAAAAAQGYQVTLAYGSGDTQNIGIGDADHPHLTNTQAYAALQQNFVKIAGTWDKMMDWAKAHPASAAAVYGWELMNEPAAYRHSVRYNGTDAAYAQSDFVQLYASHCAQLAQDIEARAEGRILVGGWGYNADFLTLAGTAMTGGSALDYLRTEVGDRLVWSAHFYPGWMGTNLLTDPAALTARLGQIFAALTGDDVLITETNIDGAVDDQAQPVDYVDLFADSVAWFAQNGIGIGWYPGAQTGSSHLIYVESDGAITIRHQHSLAHALDAFSLGEIQPAHAGDEHIAVRLIDAGLRNEPYEMTLGEGQFDPLTKFGTAFGYAGDDSLQGTVLSNDFLYGGAGHDLLRAIGGDDFLFGQGDDDRLKGGNGRDHLFGGTGRDTLDGGSGANVLMGGTGDDTYILHSNREAVREYANAGTDLVQTTKTALSLASDEFTNVENLTYIGTGNFRGIGNVLNNLITGGAGKDTLSGGDGLDTLAGLGGDNVLFGGAGGDRFVFGPETGHDRVMDFGDGADQILFRGLGGVTTLSEVMAHGAQIGADVVFDFGPSHSLTVPGITISALVGDILVA